jgi:hypothetical protein
MRTIAQKISQLSGNIRNTIYGKTPNSNTANEKEIFAKQYQRSPLETLDMSDTAHLLPENDNLKFGSKYYPSNTGDLMEEGHYMMFYIVSHNKTNFYGYTSKDGKITQQKNLPTIDHRSEDFAGKSTAVTKSGDRIDNSVLRGQTKGLTSGNLQTHSVLSDAVVLYMPSTVKSTYGADYENANTELAGFLGEQFADIIGGNGSFFDKVKQGGGAFLDAAEPLLTRALTGALSIIPGVGDINAAIDKGLGRAINPQQEFVFKSVPFRQFSYSFVFAPKNEEEMKSAHDIINLFKFHMLPEFNNGLSQGRYFKVPSEFEIRYMYRDRENLYLPKVSRCALTAVDVDYAPQGKFKTFYGDQQGASPVIMNMNLSFTEMEIMTKETIAKGY